MFAFLKIVVMGLDCKLDSAVKRLDTFGIVDDHPVSTNDTNRSIVTR